MVEEHGQRVLQERDANSLSVEKRRRLASVALTGLKQKKKIFLWDEGKFLNESGKANGALLAFAFPFSFICKTDDRFSHINALLRLTARY